MCRTSKSSGFVFLSLNGLLIFIESHFPSLSPPFQFGCFQHFHFSLLFKQFYCDMSIWFVFTYLACDLKAFLIWSLHIFLFYFWSQDTNFSSIDSSRFVFLFFLFCFYNCINVRIAHFIFSLLYFHLF
jgi:hypothetical protein